MPNPATALRTLTPSPPQRSVVDGFVSTTHPAPSGFTEPVWVIVPEHSSTVPIGPCEWGAIHGSSLPKQGAACVVAFDEREVATVVWWEGPYVGGGGGGKEYKAKASGGLALGGAESNEFYIATSGVLEGMLAEHAVTESKLSVAVQAKLAEIIVYTAGENLELTGTKFKLAEAVSIVKTLKVAEAITGEKTLKVKEGTTLEGELKAQGALVASKTLKVEELTTAHGGLTVEGVLTLPAKSIKAASLAEGEITNAYIAAGAGIEESKLNISGVVKLAGEQTITGKKTLEGGPLLEGGPTMRGASPDAELGTTLISGAISKGASTTAVSLYAAGTTYGKGAIVEEGSGGYRYISLEAGNKGHTPKTSPANWEVFTAWSFGAGWVEEGVNAHHETGHTVALSYAFTKAQEEAGVGPFVAGALYLVTIVLATGSHTASASTFYQVWCGGSSGALSNYGEQKEEVLCTGVAGRVFTVNVSEKWVGTIEEITVEHLIPSTAAMVVQNEKGVAAWEVRTPVTPKNILSVGINAGRALLASAGASENSFFGASAGASCTLGSTNTFFGFGAGKNITTGKYNLLMGANAGSLLTTAFQNVALGASSLGNARAVEGTVAIGYKAGGGLVVGVQNTFVGEGAWSSMTEGSGNLSIGYGVGSGVKIANEMLLLGYEASCSEKLSKSAAIGYQAKVEQSESITIGKAGYKVGIGVGKPGYALDVAGEGHFSEGILGGKTLRIEELTTAHGGLTVEGTLTLPSASIVASYIKAEAVEPSKVLPATTPKPSGAENTVVLGVAGVSRKITAAITTKLGTKAYKVKHGLETKALQVGMQNEEAGKELPGEGLFTGYLWKAISLSEIELEFTPAGKEVFFVTVTG